MLGGDEALNGATAIARIVGHSTHSQHPSEFTIAPVGAIGTLLARLGWTADDVDLFEINEAFAAQAIGCLRELGLENDRPNEVGSGISLGHPIGCTGARLIVTLIREMKRKDLRHGLVTMCIGGGQGIAAVFERD